MNQTGISQFNQARIEWAIRLRYSPMPDLEVDRLNSQMNAFRIGELRTISKTWEFMMERDGELAINSDKRKADSAGLDWQIAGDGSPEGDKHAAALQYFYNNLSATKALDQDATGGVDELIYQTLSAVDYYYSAHEILLRVDNPAAKEITAEFRHTPMWFFEARRGYLGYLKHIFDLYGQPCIAGEWLTAVNLGWMRPLSLAFAAKWFSLTDWQLFARRYGSGFLEGITDAQRDSTEWNLAAQALNQLSNDGTLLHNKDTEFKFLDQPSKNQLPFQPIVELVDRLYAKCYRGVDLATGSRGSGAASHSNAGQGTSANPVGASVQREESGILLVRDAKWVSGVFNDRIDRPILRYLFNEEPRAWFTLMPPLNDTTAEDLQALRTLVPMGMRVALKEVYQRFRWSAPNADEPCLAAPASVASSQSSVEAAPDQPGGNGHPTTDNGPRTTDKEPYGTTQPALTTEVTPIAPGADPARNPGLLPPNSALRASQSATRLMPDPQVDSSAFWSRAALAPRGADGQVLPMPSLGYALPNTSLIERLNDLTKRGLGHTRAAQSLQRKIQRQQALSNQILGTTNAPISNDFDPDQLRDDKTGRWIVESNTGTFATQPAEVPVKKSLFAKIGTALQKAGEKVRDVVAAGEFEIAGDPQDALKQLGYTADDLKRMGYSDVEPDTGEKPFEQGMQMLPPVQRAVARAAEGVVISTPKLAIAAADPLAGVVAFGSTPEGFDLKQAVLALVLPELGEYGGEIAESIAAEAGISSESALQLLNKLGGEAAVAAAIGLDQLQQILKLPPDQRKQALLDAAANAGTGLILGMLGGKKEPTEPFDPENPPVNSAEFPQEKPPGQVDLKTHEIKQPEEVQKTQPLPGGERQAPEASVDAAAPGKPEPEITTPNRKEVQPAKKARTPESIREARRVTLNANKAAGGAWEREVIDNILPQSQFDIREQIYIRSNGPSGELVRVDAIGYDKITGEIRITDAKGSPTAPLTKNQTIAYPELEKYGGVVVGKGKYPYTSGMEIPPTKVDIKVKP